MQMTPPSPLGSGREGRPGPAMRAAVIARHGGPDVIELRDVPMPRPGPRRRPGARQRCGLQQHRSLDPRGLLRFGRRLRPEGRVARSDRLPAHPGRRRDGVVVASRRRGAGRAPRVSCPGGSGQLRRRGTGRPSGRRPGQRARRGLRRVRRRTGRPRPPCRRLAAQRRRAGCAAHRLRHRPGDAGARRGRGRPHGAGHRRLRWRRARRGAAGARPGARVVAVCSGRQGGAASALPEPTAVVDRHRGEVVADAREAAPQGYDAVIDVVAGPTVGPGLGLLRPGGRWVVAGALGGWGVELDVRRLYLANLALVGSTMHTPRIFDHLVDIARRGASSDRSSPPPSPWTRCADAQRQLATRRHVGQARRGPLTAPATPCHRPPATGHRPRAPCSAVV